MKTKIKIFLVNNLKICVAFSFIFSLFLFSGCGRDSNPQYKVNLEVWGVFDSSDVLERLTGDYREVNPHVGDIKYRKFTVDSYKKDLVDALAAGQGPDILWINNTWTPSFKDKIEPAPDWLTNEKEFRDSFVDVAANDFLADGKIYAFPLSVDSLALYYNKDVFNANGITSPPKTWEEFDDDVRKITRIDPYSNITQAGAALGTAYNINRSTDILGLLMFQSGVEMTDSNKRSATFDKPVNINGKSVRAGENALEYYTKFAKSNSASYAWNPRMHYSIDSFYEGTAAMMLNYSWQYSTVKNKNAKLNFAVAPVPQLTPENPVNFANYWAMGVSKNKILSSDQKTKLAANGLTEQNYNKARINESWQLLKYLTFKNNGSITLFNGLNGNSANVAVKIDPADAYLKDTQKPAARRDLIEKQKNDPILSPFAYGNLVAKSWYQIDPDSTEKILAETIDSVNLGKSTIYEAIKLASNRISQLMRE